MDIEQLKELIKHNPNLKQQIINIFLVKKAVRKAYLLETVEINENIRNHKVNFLLNLAIQSDLVYLKESKNPVRYLISTPINLAQDLKDEPVIGHDKSIGKILGFFCWNHDFWYDETKNRITGSISVDNLEIYVEVCEKDIIDMKEFETHLINLSTAIQNTLGHTFNVTYNIRDMVSIPLLNETIEKGDKKYILEHIPEYENILYNNWTSLPNNLSKNFEFLVRNKFDIVQYIWIRFIIPDTFMLTFSNKYNGETINKLVQKFDNMIFSDENITIESIDKHWEEFLANLKYLY